MDETPSFRNEFNEPVESVIQARSVVINNGPQPMIPRDLPGMTRHVVNHANEIDWLCSVLGSPRPHPVLIEGEAGIGKKTLATKAVLEVEESYPDCVVHFEIGKGGADDAMRTGLERSSLTGLPADPRRLYDRYHQYFARRRGIVLLENPRNLNDVKRFWPRAPQMAYLVLTTRRIRWREAELLDLPQLDRGSAHELLVSAEGLAFDAAAQLYDAYGGNPGLLLNAGAVLSAGTVGLDRLVQLAGQSTSHYLFLERYASVSEGAQIIYDTLHGVPQRTFEQSLLDSMDSLYEDRPTVELRELRLLDWVRDDLWRLMTKPIEPELGGADE